MRPRSSARVSREHGKPARRALWLVAVSLLWACSGTRSDVGTGGVAGVCAVSSQPNPADQFLMPSPTNPPGCAASPYPGCGTSTESCAYAVSCQSGNVTLELSCAPGGGLSATSCSHLDDYCPAVRLLCESHGPGSEMTWRQLGGTDDRPTCPWDRPAEGTECSNFWGQAVCGYWCDRNAAKDWTIATCEPLISGNVSSGPGRWKYDSTCACL